MSVAVKNLLFVEIKLSVFHRKMNNTTLDEETKLKDTIVQTLAKSGFLTDIKAELSKKILDIIGNEVEFDEAAVRTMSKLSLKECLRSQEGVIAMYLVQDMIKTIGSANASKMLNGELEIENDANTHKNVFGFFENIGLDLNTEDDAKQTPLLIKLLQKLKQKSTDTSGTGSSQLSDNTFTKEKSSQEDS